MLLHPDSTPETVHAGLDLLAGISDGVFEVTRMLVYHGTRLCERMAREGRLTGNPLRYGYTFRDPAMTRFAEIFARVRNEAFWNYSIAYRTHDTHLAVALMKRLHEERVLATTEARLDTVRRSINRLYVDGYRGALDLALSGCGYRDAGPFIASLRGAASDLERELDSIESQILKEAPARASMFSPIRAAAASVLSFAIVSSVPACGTHVVVDRPHLDGGAGGSSAAPGGGTAGSASCDGSIVDPTPDQIRQIVSSASACFSGLAIPRYGSDPPAAYLDLNGWVGMDHLGLCGNSPSAFEQAAIAALEPVCANPPPPGTISLKGATVDGGAGADGEKLSQAIETACSTLASNSVFSIQLDVTGKVVGVTADSAPPGLADCVLTALEGLSFPCLANLEVCAEPVIVE